MPSVSWAVKHGGIILLLASIRELALIKRQNMESLALGTAQCPYGLLEESGNAFG